MLYQYDYPGAKVDRSHISIPQTRQALHIHRSIAEKDPSTGARETPHHLKPILEATDSTQIPFFSTSLATAAEPLTYRISHDSEFVELGARSHWLFVKDASNTHVLYALQAVWSDQVPIIEAVLRRPGEFLPQVGAVSVQIRKTPGGSFRLVTSTVPDIGNIVEIPDRETKSRQRAKTGLRGASSTAVATLCGKAGGKMAKKRVLMAACSSHLHGRRCMRRSVYGPRREARQVNLRTRPSECVYVGEKKVEAMGQRTRYI